MEPRPTRSDPDAQYNLGAMYANGQGVPQDEVESFRWLRLAAEQGHAEAQYSLGVMYSLGLGVLRDFVIAHMWLNIADANGVVAESGGPARFRHERLRYKSRIPGRANSLSKPQRDGDDQNQEDAVGRGRSIVEGPQLRQDLD